MKCFCQLSLMLYALLPTHLHHEQVAGLKFNPHTQVRVCFTAPSPALPHTQRKKQEQKTHANANTKKFTILDFLIEKTF
jgi:hypothetical protein